MFSIEKRRRSKPKKCNKASKYFEKLQKICKNKSAYSIEGNKEENTHGEI
jgi:hypothetical protein